MHTWRTTSLQLSTNADSTYWQLHFRAEGSDFHRQTEFAPCLCDKEQVLVFRKILYSTYLYLGTAVAQWLRCCATNRKVAGSIPAGVSGYFIDIKSFRSHYGPGIDSASNRNEYQEYFLGVKAVGA